MNAAVIIGIAQVLGYLLVLGVQKYFISGLRDSIKDQSTAIDALKAQAAGQASITDEQRKLNEQMRQIMSSTLADMDKRVAIIRETYDIEKQAIQQKLENAQASIAEQRNIQLNEVKALDPQPEIAKLLTTLIEENASTKEDLVGIGNQINNLISTAQVSLQNIQPAPTDSPAPDRMLARVSYSGLKMLSEEQEDEIVQRFVAHAYSISIEAAFSLQYGDLFRRIRAPYLDEIAKAIFDAKIIWNISLPIIRATLENDIPYYESKFYLSIKAMYEQDGHKL